MEATPQSSKSPRSKRKVTPGTEQHVTTKRRRSTRRKSLLDVIKYADDISEKPSAQAEPKLENVKEIGDAVTKKRKIDASPIQRDSETPLHPDLAFIFSQHRKLEQESKKWDKLLQRFVKKEQEIKNSSVKHIETESTPKNKSKRLDTQETAKEVEILEQRFVRSVKRISQAIRIANDIKDRQKARLQARADQLHTDIYNKYSRDPRDVMHEIFRLDTNFAAENV